MRGQQVMTWAAAWPRLLLFHLCSFQDDWTEGSECFRIVMLCIYYGNCCPSLGESVETVWGHVILGTWLQNLSPYDTACLYNNLITGLWISRIPVGHACIVCSGIQCDFLLREPARTAIAHVAVVAQVEVRSLDSVTGNWCTAAKNALGWSAAVSCVCVCVCELILLFMSSVWLGLCINFTSCLLWTEHLTSDDHWMVTDIVIDTSVFDGTCLFPPWC